VQLGQRSRGHWALLLGFVAAVVIFGLLFSLPDEVIDAIPNALIPAIYTAIAWGVFEKLQGKLPRDNNTSLIFYCGGFT